MAMKVATEAGCTSPCTELVLRDCVVTPPASCAVSAVCGMRSRKAGVDALERRGLRVGDVARDVFQRVGLRAEAADRRRKSAEDTHDIFSKFDPGGSPVSTNRGQAASGEDVASVVPNNKI